MRSKTCKYSIISKLSVTNRTAGNKAEKTPKAKLCSKYKLSYIYSAVCQLFLKHQANSFRWRLI